MSRRRGFSLIDLVVILAIIAILIGLLLPAAQRMRSTSERVRDMNNVKQILVAMHNENAVVGSLPSVCDFGDDVPTGRGVQSLFFRILPYIEQDRVYKLFDKNSPATYYDGKTGAAKTHLDVFISPLDRSVEREMTTTIDVEDALATKPFANKFTGTYALTSYAANGMVFVPNMKMANILDGLSPTIALVQRYRACRTSAKEEDVVYNVWGLGAYGASTPSVALAPPSDEKYPMAKPPLAQFVPPSGGVPADGEIEGTSGGKPIKFSEFGKSASCGFQVVPRGELWCDPRVPQAMVQSGVMMGFCDGSVHFWAPNLSPNTFWGAVTPNGYERLTELD